MFDIANNRGIIESAYLLPMTIGSTWFFPGTCTIKLITAVIYGFYIKLERLSLASFSSLVQCLWVGFGLARKHWTRLEKLATDKHPSLLRKSVNNGHNKFYSTGPSIIAFVLLLQIILWPVP